MGAESCEPGLRVGDLRRLTTQQILDLGAEIGLQKEAINEEKEKTIWFVISQVILRD